MTVRTRQRRSTPLAEFRVTRTRTRLSGPFTCNSPGTCVPTTSPEARLRCASQVATTFSSTTSTVEISWKEPSNSRYWRGPGSIGLLQAVVTTWWTNCTLWLPGTALAASTNTASALSAVHKQRLREKQSRDPLTRLEGARPGLGQREFRKPTRKVRLLLAPPACALRRESEWAAMASLRPGERLQRLQALTDAALVHLELDELLAALLERTNEL